MTLEKRQRAIGIFAKRWNAELALQELKAANFPMHKVSVIARNAVEQSDIAGVEVGDHTGNISQPNAATGDVTSTALGSLTSLLVGLALLVIPGIGPVMLAGAEAKAIATILAGSVSGATAGSLGGALRGFGIPQVQAQVYNDLVSKDCYLVIVTGTEAQINIAKIIFHHQSVQDWGIYQLSPLLNTRFRNAIGVFSSVQNALKALTQLKIAGFPMNHVSVIGKDGSIFKDIGEINIRSSQDMYMSLGISDELARQYENRVNFGDYLIALYGTDIHIAGARTILESNKVQDFYIYDHSTVKLKVLI